MSPLKLTTNWSIIDANFLHFSSQSMFNIGSQIKSHVNNYKLLVHIIINSTGNCSCSHHRWWWTRTTMEFSQVFLVAEVTGGFATAGYDTYGDIIVQQINGGFTFFSHFIQNYIIKY
ncbi:unnamed protein product [Lactuca saligna]|uniref:Uncharacterized protein n=1 Tax=Lactuca saligna TaxID=75948 RepID=A0AA35YNM6_LACSI|nr:unnamed protein product [Lactuca saligna]